MNNNTGNSGNSENSENSENNNKQNFTPRKPSRHFARELMIQSLYQWKIAHDNGENIVLNFEQIKQDLHTIPTYKNASLEFLQEICNNIFINVEELLTIIENVLDRTFKELSPVEGSVILLSAYELKFCPQTPTLVIINEAIELVKKFGSSEGYKYVNVIAELLAKEIRKDENIISSKHHVRSKNKKNKHKHKQQNNE